MRSNIVVRALSFSNVRAVVIYTFFGEDRVKRDGGGGDGGDGGE